MNWKGVNLLFSAVILTAAAACSTGCSNQQDAAAEAVLQQAESSQSMADFAALIDMVDSNPAISEDCRKQCIYLAVVILQKHIVQYRTDRDAVALQKLTETLDSEAAARYLPRKFFQEQLEEACQYAQQRRTPPKSNIRHQKFRQLQAVFHRCDPFGQEISPEAVDSLENIYLHTAPEALQKYIASYIKYTRLQSEKNLSGSHPELAELLAENIVSECSYCEKTGKDLCQICKGSGVCRICKGDGYRSLHKQIQFSGGRWSYQEGWHSKTQNHISDSGKIAVCPKQCADCQGRGWLQPSCRVCHGSKYLLNHEKLAKLLKQQYLFTQTLLTELVAVTSADAPTDR